MAIKKKKQETSIESLCKGCPREFQDYMEYCRALKFEQEPDYKLLLGLFRRCMEKNDIEPTSTDFIWKRNQLQVQKQRLIESIKGVIGKERKKPESPNLLKQKNGDLVKKQERSNMAHIGVGIVQNGSKLQKYESPAEPNAYAN